MVKSRVPNVIRRYSVLAMANPQTAAGPQDADYITLGFAIVQYEIRPESFIAAIS